VHDAESENGILKAATACPPSAHLLKLLHAFLGKGKKKEDALEQLKVRMMSWE